MVNFKDIVIFKKYFFNRGSFLLFFYLLIFSPNPARSLTIEAGDFVTEINRLKGLIFAKDSELYVAPTAQERTDFSALAASVLAGNVENGGAADLATNALDYEFVQFTDNPTGKVYYALREELVGGNPTRGWGSYFMDLNFQSNALVEVPHPLYDTNTPEIGAKAFRESEARGFLMAGAHRYANAGGAADMSHVENSIFQEVHKAWNGVVGETTAWQIHGFNLDNHPTFPQGPDPAAPDAVFSNGDGGVSSEIVALDAQFANNGRAGYSFNNLAADDTLNIQVNDGIIGTTFQSLGATTNVQGIYSRAIGGEFIHIELEQSMRLPSGEGGQAARDLAAAMISEAIQLNTVVGTQDNINLGDGVMIKFLGIDASGRTIKIPSTQQIVDSMLANPVVAALISNAVFDITTTATLVEEAGMQVTLAYSQADFDADIAPLGFSEDQLQLFHFTGGNVITGTNVVRDIFANTITATFASATLSDFGVGVHPEPATLLLLGLALLGLLPLRKKFI